MHSVLKEKLTFDLKKHLHYFFIQRILVELEVFIKIKNTFESRQILIRLHKLFLKWVYQHKLRDLHLSFWVQDGKDHNNHDETKIFLILISWRLITQLFSFFLPTIHQQSLFLTWFFSTVTTFWLILRFIIS